MKRLKPLLDVLVTLLVIVAAGLVIWRQLSPPGSSPSRVRVQDFEGTIPAELAATVRGSGPVALVEFADFECSFCAKHAREVEPMIRNAFVDAGVVRQVFLHYPLPNHQRAAPASEAALCAGMQGKFWEMHDALFENPGALQDNDFVARAGELGLDMATFDSCFRGGRSRATLERHKEFARTKGVQSTPAFFLGIVQGDGSVVLKKRLNGALPFDDFHSAILEVTPSEFRARVRNVVLNSSNSVAAVR